MCVVRPRISPAVLPVFPQSIHFVRLWPCPRVRRSLFSSAHSRREGGRGRPAHAAFFIRASRAVRFMQSLRGILEAGLRGFPASNSPSQNTSGAPCGNCGLNADLMESFFAWLEQRLNPKFLPLSLSLAQICILTVASLIIPLCPSVSRAGRRSQRRKRASRD